MNDPVTFYPAGHTYTWADVGHTGVWVEGMIPAGGSVILFGPAGVGKTTVVCNMMNAINQKQQFIGRNTNPTNCMLLSLDTPQDTLKRRWLQNVPPFEPKFAFMPYAPFDCLHQDFRQSLLFNQAQGLVKEKNIELIVVDSLRDVFSGDMNNDDIPKQVYQTFQEWFGYKTVVFLHHTRKQQMMNGKPIETNIDDEATGTKYWIYKAQVALYLQRANEKILSLKMGKSQCFDQWDEPLKLEVDGMFVSEWTKTKAQQYSATYSAALTTCQAADPNWGNLSETEKNAVIAKHLNVQPRTVRTMKAAFKKMIP